MKVKYDKFVVKSKIFISNRVFLEALQIFPPIQNVKDISQLKVPEKKNKTKPFSFRVHHCPLVLYKTQITPATISVGTFQMRLQIKPDYDSPNARSTCIQTHNLSSQPKPAFSIM